MPDIIYQAQPPLEFIPPALDPLFLRGVQLVLPHWIRWKTAINHIEADNVEVLVDLYRQFQEGKIRFMLAFRHPKTEDPFALGYLLYHILPKVARHGGTALQHPIHAHFIYDRGIPLWAGSHVGWIVSHLGATPFNEGKQIGRDCDRHVTYLSTVSFPWRLHLKVLPMVFQKLSIL